MKFNFRPAVIPDFCKECGDDIWPGDVILRVLYREPKGHSGWFRTKVTLCKDCGELFKESQELGSNA